MTCKICGAPSKAWARALILAKYSVSYFLCAECGFVCTEKPFWLPEAYSDAIAITDTGIVGRNLAFASATDFIIRAFYNQGGDFLDFGGGTGLFVRLMRDRGFRFKMCDQYGSNSLARGFEIRNLCERRFELVTAFEVFEHLEEPRTIIEKLLTCTDSLLISTALIASPPPSPNEWWYYALDTGQHISFYTERSMAAIGRTYGLNVYSARGLHLLTRKRIPEALFWVIGVVARVPSWVRRRRSLQFHDCAELQDVRRQEEKR